MKRSFRDLSGIERQTLYVGLDNSNHAGTRKGEIITAVFSFSREDSIVKYFGKQRDSLKITNWLKDEETPRDYRFGVLIDEKYRHTHQNIPVAAPDLIFDFLKSLDFSVSGINIYIDGILRREHKEFLRGELQNVSGRIVINNFVKRQGIQECPMLVYAADILSNDLYNGGFREVAEHPKGVVLRAA